jgi:hypothetical protein
MFTGRPVVALASIAVFLVAVTCGTDKTGKHVETTSGGVDKTLFAPPRQFVYPPDGVVIGQGWDSFTERGTQAQCVAVTEVAIESSSFDTSVEEIKSTFGLLKEQGMSASLGGSFGGFGGSGSVSSTSSKKLETDFANVLFSFDASTGSTRAIGVGGAGESFAAFKALDADGKKAIETAQPAAQSYAFQMLAQEPRPRRGSAVELTPAAITWLIRGDTATFQRVCGDGFVSAIHRGTRVRVLATFQSSNEKDKTTFAATLEAKGFGVSASGSYSSSTDEAALNTKTRYSISQQGGIPFPPPQKFDDLLAMFSKTENFIEKPGAFAVTVTPYTTVANYPLAIGLESPQRLKRLGDYYVVLSDLYTLTSQALRYASNPALESPYDRKMIEAYGGVPHLRKLKDAIHSDLKMLEAGITACYRNRSGCDEATIKNESIKSAETAANSLQPFATKLQDQTRTLKVSVANGDKLGAAKNLSSITGGVVQIDSVEKQIALLDQELARVTEIIAQLHDITGVLKSSESEISDAFFQRFYSYLIEIPLAKDQFSPELKVGTDDAAIQNITNELRNAILTNRLMPWKQYFCKEAMSDYLCVYDEQLVRLVNKASLEFAKNAVTIKIPQTVCHYSFNGNEITKEQYDAEMKALDSGFALGGLKKLLSMNCGVVYVSQ